MSDYPTCSFKASSLTTELTVLYSLPTFCWHSLIWTFPKSSSKSLQPASMSATVALYSISYDQCVVFMKKLSSDLSEISFGAPVSPEGGIIALNFVYTRSMIVAPHTPVLLEVNFSAPHFPHRKKLFIWWPCFCQLQYCQIITDPLANEIWVFI